jgi:hypothetical protein
MQRNTSFARSAAAGAATVAFHPVDIMLGRSVAVYHRSSTLHQIR